MKYFFLFLLFSSQSQATLVFMEETPSAKTIELTSSRGRMTINDTSRGEWALYPDISADAQIIIYSEGKGPEDLHLTYKGPEQTWRFYHPHKGMLLHPKMTRNQRLVFYSAPGTLGKNTIYYFNPKEEARKQGNFIVDYLLQNPEALVPEEEAYFPRPSSDGSFVVYQRNREGKKEIVLFDRVANKKAVLAEGMSPALSFDERLIAYTSRKNGSWNVFEINRFTGEVKELTTDPHDEMAPSYKPTGELIFASNKSGAFRLYEQGATKNWKVLTTNAEREVSHYSPQISGEQSLRQGELNGYLGEARSSFGTVMHRGHLYMAGGHQGKEHTYPPESFSDQLLSFDLEKNEWKELAPRPHKAHGFQMAAYGKYLYAFGGFAYSENHKPRWRSLDVIDRYDIETNEWKTIGKLNVPRSSNVAVTIGNKVYLLAGWDSTPKKENDLEGKFHDTVEIFDLETEDIQLASYKMPQPLRRALTGVAYQGKILLVGGLGVGSSHFELISHVTMIDPISGLAEEKAPLPFPTFAPAAGMIGDELFVFGGMFKTGTWDYEYVSHIYGLSMESGSWRHTGRSLQETKGFSQVFNLSPDTLGILGGHRYFEGFDSPVKTFETLSK